jgi:hypothetical protein
MAKSTSLLSLLAKELGYKDAKKLKERLHYGDNIAGGVKSRLEEGQGFGESFSGSFQDKKESIERSLDPKNIRKKAYMSFFGGDNILSSYMRGRFKKKSEKEKSLSPSKELEGSDDPNDLISVLAKNSLALPGMAKDMNILRQNMVALVKLERGADDEKDLQKQGDFFKSSDTFESQLEEQRKATSPTAAGKGKNTSPTNESSSSKTKKTTGAGGDSGGLLGGIIDFFKNGLLGALGMIFSPANILKSLGKIFLIAAVITSLFEGITAGFKKWQETGDLSEAILTGLGAMLDFLTFGLFGEDQLRELVKQVGDVIGPIIDDISDSFTKMKDWIANNIGIPEIRIPIPKILQKVGAPEKITIGPYYPFKDNPKTGEAQTSALKSKAPSDSEMPAIPEPPKELKDAVKGTPLEQLLQPSQVSGKAQDNLKQIIQPMKLPKDAMKNPSALMDTMVNMQQKQIDHVKKLNAQGDYSLGDAKQLEKGLAESKKQLAIGQNKLSGAGDMMSSSMNNAGDILTKKIQGGGAAENSLDKGGASMLSPSTSSPSTGSDLGKASSQVSEGQRMESSAEGGSFLNSPVTNNTSGGTGMNIKTPPADTHNHELIGLLMRT